MRFPVAPLWIYSRQHQHAHDHPCVPLSLRVLLFYDLHDFSGLTVLSGAAGVHTELRKGVRASEPARCLQQRYGSNVCVCTSVPRATSPLCTGRWRQVVHQMCVAFLPPGAAEPCVPVHLHIPGQVPLQLLPAGAAGLPRSDPVHLLVPRGSPPSVVACRSSRAGGASPTRRGKWRGPTQSRSCGASSGSEYSVLLVVRYARCWGSHAVPGWHAVAVACGLCLCTKERWKCHRHGGLQLTDSVGVGKPE